MAFTLAAHEVLAATETTGDTPLPNKVLWAWQRDEDLRFINPSEYGVAYLACSALLIGDTASEHWRDQPLKVPPHTVLCPVLRIDSDRRHPPTLSGRQRNKLLAIVRKMSRLPHTAQIQIDFDALESERAFYRDLLEQTHRTLPETKVSITALTSWCLFDNWIKDLPVVETVPMLFSLGPERSKILLYFRTNRDFLVPGCCHSLGLSLEDSEVNQLMIPQAKRRTIPVRYYIFTRTAWNRKKFDALQLILGAQ